MVKLAEPGVFRGGESRGCEPPVFDHGEGVARLHALIGDGTQKAAAERLGVSQQYLSDVLNEAREPGPLILAGLGIERVVTYRTVGVLVDYSFRCYSCSKEWEATTTTTDCPACGTTNNHCAANPRGVEGTKNG